MRDKKHKFIYNPKSGKAPVLGLVIWVLGAEILAPSVIEVMCNYGYIPEGYVCNMAREEPLKQDYSDFYTNDIQATTVSGTMFTAAPSPSPAPGPFDI